jgi:hypothetical protein
LLPFCGQAVGLRTKTNRLTSSQVNGSIITIMIHGTGGLPLRRGVGGRRLNWVAMPRWFESLAGWENQECPLGYLPLRRRLQFRRVLEQPSICEKGLKRMALRVLELAIMAGQRFGTMLP